MDTQNEQQANPTAELLQQWWTSKIFDGKEHCELNDAGELRIPSLSDKVISKLNHVTGDAVIQSLLDKYKDFAKQLDELQKEWATSDDKLRLMGKIQRVQDYLGNVHAIGNFEAIQKQLKDYETTIQEKIEANYQEKVAFIKNAEALVADPNNWKEATQQLKDLAEKWKSMGFIDRKRNEELWGKFEELKTKFFENKRHHHDEMEKDLLQNLDLKMEIVDKAEAIAASENWKETTEAFKDLFAQWKAVGKTLTDKNEQLWQRYIAAQNSFFDRKKIHTDNIKVEQEQNYLRKTEIVQKAEAIKDSTDWNITTKAYNDLQAEWKSIGHTPSEYGNTLWERYVAAKDFFYDAKRIQTDAFKKTLEDNYTLKSALVDRVEAIKNSTSWRETTEELNLLFDQWKQIGHVSRIHGDTLWEKFIAARKHFFSRKDQDRERRKEQYEKNKELAEIEMRHLLKKLEFETADEQEQIIEFTNTLNTTTTGPKSEEIKEHLSSLILDIEQRIKNRADKIAKLKEQVSQAEQKEHNTETPTDQ